MWQSKLFGSLPVLLDFVNGHGLEHHQFKVVVVPPRLWQRRSSPRYYLIYRMEATDPLLVGVAGARALGGIDEEAAVDTAEEIIHSAQHRDDPGGGPVIDPARPARVGIAAHLLSFAASYRQAGVSRYIAELLRAFAAGGDGAHEYTVFAGPARPPGAFASLGIAPGGGLRWRHSRLPTARPPVRIAWEQVAGPVAARRARLDLLHGPVNVLPLGAPCPGVVTVHDLAFLAYPDAFHPAKRRYLGLLTALSLRRAARAIAVSAFTRDEIVRRLGVPAAKVAVVPNAADASFAPRPAGEVARFRAERGLPTRMILSVGTLEPRKNLVGLLQSFARVAPATDATLVVVGAKGWLYDELFARLDALGLAGRVRFAGRVPDGELPLWYNAAEVFVYPSRYEGFGLPPLEALACGVPVVTSDAASMPEVVGDAAILADPADPAALAAALARVLDDAGLRATLRERGPRRAAQFSWARTAAATRAVYDEVLSGLRAES